MREISGNLIKDVFAGLKVSRANMSLRVTILTSMILELRFMIYHSDSGTTSLYNLIVVPLISNKFVEQSRNRVYDNKLKPDTLADPVITKTLKWVTMVMEKSVYLIIRLTIRRRLLGLSQQFLQQNLD